MNTMIQDSTPPRIAVVAWQRALLFLLATSLPGLAVAQAAATVTEGDTWTLAERSLPAPAGASDALREAIAGSSAPFVGQFKAMTTLNEQLIQMLDQMNPVNLEELQQQAGVAIEKATIASVPVFRVTPKQAAPEHEGHLFFHVHGGGYVLGGGDSAVGEAALIAGALGLNAVSVDYRMPPDHPFPAAVDDAVAVYRKVAADHPAAKIFIGGTSAGGGLSLAIVHRLKELGIDLPGALWLGTPWADLTKTSDSLYTNEGIDRVLVTYDGLIQAMAELYAGDESLTHPLISPLYGDFEGFPPTQLVTGTRDMFLSDTARTHRKLRAAGVTADLNVYEGMSHAEYLMVLGSPESRQVFSDLGAFLVEHLP